MIDISDSQSEKERVYQMYMYIHSVGYIKGVIHMQGRDHGFFGQLNRPII
jgi:hypothetical protein